MHSICTDNLNRVRLCIALSHITTSWFIIVAIIEPAQPETIIFFLFQNFVHLCISAILRKTNFAHYAGVLGVLSREFASYAHPRAKHEQGERSTYILLASTRCGRLLLVYFSLSSLYIKLTINSRHSMLELTMPRYMFCTCVREKNYRRRSSSNSSR